MSIHVGNADRRHCVLFMAMLGSTEVRSVAYVVICGTCRMRRVSTAGRWGIPGTTRRVIVRIWLVQSATRLGWCVPLSPGHRAFVSIFLRRVLKRKAEKKQDSWISFVVGTLRVVSDQLRDIRRRWQQVSNHELTDRIWLAGWLAGRGLTLRRSRLMFTENVIRYTLYRVDYF